MTRLTRTFVTSSAIALASLGIFAAGCGGGTGGGPGPGPGNCIVDTSDITTGTIIRGTVQDDSLVALPNLFIQFYRANGTLIRTARTSCSGGFAVSMAEVPARFSIQNSSIPNLVYRTYRYDGLWYDPTTNDCRAPLTGIFANGDNLLGTIRMVRRTSPPPPPPTGCL